MNLTIVCVMKIVPRLGTQSPSVLGPKTNNTMNQLQTNDELVRDPDYHKKRDSGCGNSQVDFNSKSYNCTKRMGFLGKRDNNHGPTRTLCVCVSMDGGENKSTWTPHRHAT
jgi:hypothetical protein